MIQHTNKTDSLGVDFHQVAFQYQQSIMKIPLDVNVSLCPTCLILYHAHRDVKQQELLLLLASIQHHTLYAVTALQKRTYM